MWDLLIKNVEIVDGTGSPSYKGDIAIKGEKIDAVGRDFALSIPGSVDTIDAAHLTAIPGIIDPHSHADLIVGLDFETQSNLLKCKLFQGVTTIIVGNCGLGTSPATTLEATTVLRGINSWMAPEEQLPSSATSLYTTNDAYLNRLENSGVAINVAMLIPHGPVRISVMGLAKELPSSKQLNAMKSLVQEGFDAGAFGLSTGLIYPPGSYSSPDELTELAKVVARSDRIYTSHIRGSSDTLLKAVDELITVGKKSLARVHHSHNEAVGEQHWSNIDRVLGLEEAALRSGLQISFDMFPYTMAATMMVAIYPPWALEGGIESLIARLQDHKEREKIRRAIEKTPSKWNSWAGKGWPHNLVRAVGWDNIYIGYVQSAEQKKFENLSLQEFGEQIRRSPFDAVSDLIISEKGQVSMLIHEISGEQDSKDDYDKHLLKFMCHPLSAFCSDAEDYGKGHPHPASYGAFAKIFSRYVGKLKAISFEEAVRKMTGYTAKLFGIRDRGLIRPGMYADIALIDRTKLSDHSNIKSPRLLATGVEHLLLNGKLTIKNGNYLGQRGKVLRKER